MRWRREIIATGLTNGRTEGLNNKAKVVKRRAYGDRSFRNYRLRFFSLGGGGKLTLWSNGKGAYVNRWGPNGEPVAPAASWASSAATESSRARTKTATTASTSATLARPGARS